MPSSPLAHRNSSAEFSTAPAWAGQGTSRWLQPELMGLAVTGICSTLDTLLEHTSHFVLTKINPGYASTPLHHVKQSVVSGEDGGSNSLQKHPPVPNENAKGACSKGKHILTVNISHELVNLKKIIVNTHSMFSVCWNLCFDLTWNKNKVYIDYVG